MRRIDAAHHAYKHAEGELNQGLQKRWEYTKGSRTAYCTIRLESDVLSHGKYLPNGVDMKIKISRSKPAFALHTTSTGVQSEYKIEFIDPKLIVTWSKIFPPVWVNQNNRLARDEARYLIRRTTIKPITIPARTLTFTADNVTVGQIPKRVLVMFVKNSAVDGNYRQNPYNFETINLTRIALYVNGRCVPSMPYTPKLISFHQIILVNITGS